MKKILSLVALMAISGCVATTNNSSEPKKPVLDPIPEGHARVFISGTYDKVKKDDSADQAAITVLKVLSGKGPMANFTFNFIEKKGDTLLPLYVSFGNDHHVSYYYDVPEGEFELLMASRNVPNFYALQSSVGQFSGKLDAGNNYQLIGGFKKSKVFKNIWGVSDVTLSKEEQDKCFDLRASSVGDEKDAAKRIQETVDGADAKACHMIYSATKLPEPSAKYTKWVEKKKEAIISGINK